MTGIGGAESGGDQWREHLTALWRRSWGDAEPAGEPLRRDHGDRWVRLHTLPGGTRYANSPAQRAEVAHRQQAVLADLVHGDHAAPVHVVTSWWWRHAEPPCRMPLRRRYLVPGTGAVHRGDRAPRRDGRWWRSFQDPCGAQDVWTQLRVARRRVGHPSVRELLRLTAEDEAAGVLVTDPGFRWLLAPYDGGVDVFTPTVQERDAVAQRFRAWRSDRTDGM